MDIDALLDEMEEPAYRTSKTVRILVGKARVLLDEHEAADKALGQALEDDARLNREPQAPALAVQVAQLEQRVEDAKTAFRFVSIGRKKWADLVASHPPSKDVLKADPRAEVDPETFPVEAIAASLVEPLMTVEQVRRLEQSCDDAQWNVLWGACLAANVGGLESPKSVLAGSILRASELSVTTAVSAASLDQPS